MRFTYFCPGCNYRFTASRLRRCLDCDRRYCTTCIKSHCAQMKHSQEPTAHQAKQVRDEQAKLAAWQANAGKECE